MSRQGHAFDVRRRDFPDRPGVPPKLYLTCSCGYVAAVRRTERAVVEAGAAHLRTEGVIT